MQLTTLIMAQGLAANAHAQTTAPANNPDGVNASPQSLDTAATAGNSTAPTQLPEVVVVGSDAENSYQAKSVTLPQFSEPLRDTPQSVTVVPKVVMQDQNSMTLRDVLRNVAGISIAAGEGGSQGDNLTLRGFTARNDIFLDGLRDYGSYYRDPFNYEQVDVLSGPESVMFGRGSTGGVINQESKTPEMNPFVEGALTVGTDLTRRATADINEPLPDLAQGAAFRLNLMGHESEVAERDVGRNRRYGIAPSLAFGLGTPTQVSVSYLHQSEDDIPDYGIPWHYNSPANVPRANYYGFQDDYLRTDVDMVTIQVNHDSGDSLSLHDAFRFANYSREFRITEPKLDPSTTPATPGPATIVDRNELGGHSVETFLWNQFDATSRFDTGPIQHTLITGLEAGRETSDPTRFGYTGVPTTNLISPNEDQDFTGVATVKSRVTTTAESFGAYALDTLKLGSHWELSGGVRWDYFHADYHESVAGVAFSRTDTMPSFRGALVYKPTHNGSIYFDYGTSWNPSAESLSLSAANANTPPEKNETFELGTKWDLFSNKLSVRGALFRTEKTNAREPDPSDPTQNVLGGDQRVDGVELAMSGHLTDRWQVLGSYDYLQSEVISSKFYPGSVGYPLANVPKHTLSVWTTYQLPWHLEVGLGADVVSSRTASSTAPLDPTTGLLKEVGGYWTLNAMVKYQVSKRVDIQVNVYNLTNRYYYDQIHPGHIIPGAGVSALLTANFHF
ncbi:MAG TPA: TonB-dependent siderophore receptor [Opitutales bacterium]|nr:TonB-dependent siderophore receptor [Opitutales bacterium]